MAASDDIAEFIALESALAGWLQDFWGAALAAVFVAVADAVNTGDFAAAYEAVESMSAPAITKKVRATATGYTTEAGLFGMALVTPQTEFQLSKAAKGTLAVAAASMMSLAEQAVTEACHAHLVQLIAKAQAEANAAPIPPPDSPPVQYLSSTQFPAFKQVGDTALYTIAGLHISRLAVWGFTEEAEVRGAIYYELIAVLDSRTSNFCWSIHGKRFKVADARRTILLTLQTADPNQLKNLQPWPKQDAVTLETYKKMTSEELTALGLHVPPFHPRCRTMCRVYEAAT